MHPLRTAVGVALGLALVVTAVVIARRSDDSSPASTAPQPATVEGPAETGSQRPKPEPERALLFGRILDGLDNPLSGASVIVQAMLPDWSWSLEDSPVFRDRTGPDGRFGVGLPAAREVAAIIEHAGYAPEVLDGPFALAPGVELDLGDVVLRSRPGLVVELSDPTGAPIAGGWVDAEPLLESHRLPAVVRAALRRRARTDDRGRAILAALSMGTHRLTARAREHVASERIWRQDPAAAADPLRIELQRGRILLCRVVKPGGEGVEGARIVAEPLGPGPVVRGDTDQTGACELDQLPAGPLRLRAEVAGWGELEREPVDGSEATVILTLPGDAVAEGEVVDRWNRTPVVGAQVQLLAPVRIAPGLVFRPRTTTDQDGKFALLGPAGGRIDLEVTSEGFEPYRGAPLTTVRLRPAKGVTGNVMNAVGRPLLDATIELLDTTMDGTAFSALRTRIAGPDRQPPRVRSRTGGYFDLPVAERGRYVVRISASGHAPRVLGPFDLTAQGTRVGVVRLAPAARIRGHALDRNGSPAARVLVCADPQPSMPPGTPATTALTDAHGAFSLDRLAAGSYELFYYSPGRQTAASAAACHAATRSVVEVSTGEELSHNLTYR